MLKVDNRESAHLRSRIKDLSVVPNVLSYTGLFACITPISKLKPNNNNTFDPVLIRDTDSLIANFGDPRIDPEKYIDLYSIMKVVGNGSSCYIAKVPSGETGIFRINIAESGDPKDLTLKKLESQNNVWFTVIPPEDKAKYLSKNIIKLSYNDGETKDIDLDSVEYSVESASSDSSVTLRITTNSESAGITGDITASFGEGIVCYTSTSEPLVITAKISQAKPLSLNAYYLNIRLELSGVLVGSAKIKFDDKTKNSAFINNLNSVLGVYSNFELVDNIHSDDSTSIATLLNTKVTNGSELLAKGNEISAGDTATVSVPMFKVTLNDYINALNNFKDKKYTGCLMADLTAPINTVKVVPASAPDEYNIIPGIAELSTDERRTLHYNLKQIAAERKDCTVILSTPYSKEGTPLTLDGACNWVASRGDYSNLWEYGETNTTDYTLQSFYLEMYYSWLNMKCTKIENGLAKSVEVKTAPSNVVIDNVLNSYRERGVQYPVAGDQFGVLPESCTIINNPATKGERDQLVQNRINPIYDTGTRGVQIYGNETLNAGYTDLNAAHIARTLVDIRRRVDEYTETLKFSINSNILWDTWKNYVSTYILDPYKSNNALSSYSVAMGEDTTTPEEIANRTVKGNISLTFYQSAEIFDLTFTVFSSSTTVGE